VANQPPSTTITFRTSKATAAKIDALVAETGATRSFLVAMLIHAAINDDRIVSKMRSLLGGSHG